MKRLISLCLVCALLSGACAETQFADCSSGFAFLPSGVEWTDSSYRSENMSIEITAQRVCDSDVYVADLRLRTAACLRRSSGMTSGTPVLKRSPRTPKRTGRCWR